MVLKGKQLKGMKYVLIVVGTTFMALGINLFYAPMHMVTGGVSGLAIVIKEWTTEILPGGVPIWVTNIVCNIPLLLLATRIKGKKYLLQTLFATVSFTVALSIIPSFNLGFEDFLLISVFGGVLNGIGLGIVFSTQSSTGGSDLLGSLIHEKFKHYSIAQILMVIDAVVVGIGAAVFGVTRALYAVIAIFISSRVIDSIQEGLKFAKITYIISDHYEEIAKEVIKGLNRGATAISAKGMYSNSDKKMLFCVVSKKELVKIVNIVARIDQKAFLIVSDAKEVLGEGFIEYKQ